MVFMRTNGHVFVVCVYVDASKHSDSAFFLILVVHQWWSLAIGKFRENILHNETIIIRGYIITYEYLGRDGGRWHAVRMRCGNYEYE